jgi:hypothetical protein
MILSYRHEGLDKSTIKHSRLRASETADAVTRWFHARVDEGITPLTL